MRSLAHQDLTTAARALLRVPPGARAAACDRMIQQADWADRYLRKTGKTHPFWGNGTLLGAVRGAPLPPEPSLGDPEYCDCLHIVLSQLLAWRITI